MHRCNWFALKPPSNRGGNRDETAYELQPLQPLSGNCKKSPARTIATNCCQGATMSSLLHLPAEIDDLAPDLRRAAQYIDAHLDDSLTIGEVAAAAGVAGRTLHKHFHDEHGTSPMRYVRDCR